MTLPFVRIFDDHGELRPLDDINDEIMARAVDHCGPRGKTEAARQLGISRVKLYRHLKEMERS